MSVGVSHSRVEGYLMCRRKDWYGYQFPTDEGRGIRRKDDSFSLSLGTAIHRIAAVYYTAFMEGGGKFDADASAWDEFNDIINEGFEDRGGNYASLEEVVGRFLDNEEISDRFEILGVEMEFNLPSDEGDFPFVVDLLVRDLKTGLIYVVDHKTAYHLYDSEQTDLMPQIPKYVGALRALGYKVAGGFYQVIRTQKISPEKMLKAELVDALSTARPEYDPKKIKALKVEDLQRECEAVGIEHTKPVDPKKLYQFFEINLSLDRVTQTLAEQFSVAAELRERDEWPEDLQDARAWRTANQTVCKNCSFRLVCNEELRGGNVNLVLMHEYEPKPKRDAILPSEEVDDEV